MRISDWIQTCALPISVRQATEPGLPREGAAPVVAVGQARQQDPGAVGWHEAAGADRQGAGPRAAHPVPGRAPRRRGRGAEIGRASCRARVGQYVLFSGVAVSFKKKKKELTSTT